MAENDNFKTLFNELGESSSLHGIPKIVSSRQIIVKVLWCILLLGTMSIFTVQLHGLFEEYYSYPTKTSVRLNFKPLPFPAITFCNMNPIKLSSVGDYDSLVNTYISKITADYADEIDPMYRDLFDEEVYEKHNNTRDQFEKWTNRLLTEFRNLSAENRSNIGHQKEDFIHSAVFSGYYVPFNLFKEVHSHVYGNCYTLDEDSLIARGSGYKNSLYIVFNIEAEDYIGDFTSAYGVRVVFHGKGTFPLPHDEGLTLSSKTETHIGLRMSSISRLGRKYGTCTDGHEFEVKYKIKYTVPVCYSVCEIENLISQCQCLPLPSLGEIVARENMRLCDFDDDEICMKKVTDGIHSGEIKCDCKSQCKENVYSITLSSRLWPHREYLRKVLLEEYCRRHINRTDLYTLSLLCMKVNDNFFLDNYELDDASSTFLAVYIYFEDLNYETISEEPLYNTLRFLSDIGGAMGLYMGASVLTYVEILHVAIEVFLLCRRRRLRTSPVLKFGS